jgi:hypothetical protein
MSIISDNCTHLRSLCKTFDRSSSIATLLQKEAQLHTLLRWSPNPNPKIVCIVITAYFVLYNFFVWEQFSWLFVFFLYFCFFFFSFYCLFHYM